MNRRGVVLEAEGRSATVLMEGGEVRSVPRRGLPMAVGQEVWVKDEVRFSWTAAAGVAAAAVMLAVGVWSTSHSPTTLAAELSVDLSPSFELGLSTSGQVLWVHGMDSAAERLLGHVSVVGQAASSAVEALTAASAGGSSASGPGVVVLAEGPVAAHNLAEPSTFLAGLRTALAGDVASNHLLRGLHVLVLPSATARDVADANKLHLSLGRYLVAHLTGSSYAAVRQDSMSVLLSHWPAVLAAPGPGRAPGGTSRPTVVRGVLSLPGPHLARVGTRTYRVSPSAILRLGSEAPVPLAGRLAALGGHTVILEVSQGVVTAVRTPRPPAPAPVASEVLTGTVASVSHGTLRIGNRTFQVGARAQWVSGHGQAAPLRTVLPRLAGRPARVTVRGRWVIRVESTLAPMAPPVSTVTGLFQSLGHGRFAVGAHVYGLAPGTVLSRPGRPLLRLGGPLRWLDGTRVASRVVHGQIVGLQQLAPPPPRVAPAPSAVRGTLVLVSPHVVEIAGRDYRVGRLTTVTEDGRRGTASLGVLKGLAGHPVLASVRSGAVLTLEGVGSPGPVRGRARRVGTPRHGPRGRGPRGRGSRGRGSRGGGPRGGGPRGGGPRGGGPRGGGPRGRGPRGRGPASTLTGVLEGIQNGRVTVDGESWRIAGGAALRLGGKPVGLSLAALLAVIGDKVQVVVQSGQVVEITVPAQAGLSGVMHALGPRGL